MFASIYLFYVFKVAPKTIDNKSSWFWRFNVKLLNKFRGKCEGFKLWSIGRLSIRDPFSFPMKSHFAYSRMFPFCWQYMHGNGDG